MIRLASIVAIIAVIAIIGVVLVKVVDPALKRRRERQAIQDQRRNELEGVLHEQQVTMARQGWEDIQRTRARINESINNHGDNNA